jgi:hypothetical protein
MWLNTARSGSLVHVRHALVFRRSWDAGLNVSDKEWGSSPLADDRSDAAAGQARWHETGMTTW